MTDQTATGTTEATDTERHMTMTERVADLGITLTIKDGPVYGIDNGWAHNAYRVTLRRAGRGGRSITTRYRMGTALTGPPTAADVLDSLILDAGAVRSCADLAEFMRDLGYDSAGDDGETAKAGRRTWAELRRMYPRIITFLGGEAEFDRIADHTDSL